MPSASHPRRRKGALPAAPLFSPSPKRNQANLHNRGSQEFTPTSESITATLSDIHIPLAAVRQVREVVAHILRRLTHEDAPPPPVGPDLRN
jgi:hypothetical protein